MDDDHELILIAAYPDLETALIRASAFRGLRLDRSTVNSLEAAVAEAMEKIGHKTDGTLNSGTTDTSN